MKIVALLVCLLAFANSHAVADIQLTYNDMVKLYGKPDEKSAPTPYGSNIIVKRQYTFHTEDIVILVAMTNDTINSIEFDRETPFSELEIGMILKPLSEDEDWAPSRKGKDWVLQDAKTRAHWNGEGKITIQ